MLKNDKINMIIALFIAVILWSYVLGELDPVKSVTYRDIPIKFINEDVLEEKGLTITSVSTNVISLSFSGKRSKINKIGKSDFDVTINLLNVVEGDNLLDIKVSHPKDVILEDSSVEAVRLEVESVVTAEKNINIELVNLESDDDEPYIVQVSKKSVEISGAKSKVEKVNKVVAKLDATRVKNTLKSLSVKMMPVDKKGRLVDGVDLSFENVSVSAIIHRKKTVELIVPVTSTDNGVIARDLTAPKTVTIKGSAERLSSINSVTTEAVNISGFYDNTKIMLVPILPDGIELASNSLELVAEITVSDAGKKDFFFDESDVKISGVPEDYKVDIKPLDLTISIRGKSATIMELSEKDFEISASAEGLSPGKHELKLEVEVKGDGIDDIKLLPETIKVEIEN